MFCLIIVVATDTDDCRSHIIRSVNLSFSTSPIQLSTTEIPPTKMGMPAGM
jgi:hypothetical protein